MEDLFKLVFNYYPEGVDLKDDFCTPLQAIVMRKPHYGAAKALLRTGMVDVNSTTDSGSTPLSSAVTNARCELIPLLVEHGADLDCVLGLHSDGEAYLKQSPAFPDHQIRVLETLLESKGIFRA